MSSLLLTLTQTTIAHKSSSHSRRSSILQRVPSDQLCMHQFAREHAKHGAQHCRKIRQALTGQTPPALIFQARSLPSTFTTLSNIRPQLLSRLLGGKSSAAPPLQRKFVELAIS